MQLSAQPATELNSQYNAMLDHVRAQAFRETSQIGLVNAFRVSKLEKKGEIVPPKLQFSV